LNILQTKTRQHEYARMPKNGLVLTSINKSGKYTFLLEEIDEYSDYLM
jgi:hypothetical protein